MTSEKADSHVSTSRYGTEQQDIETHLDCSLQTLGVTV